jgi:hypothetical protein
MDRDAYDNSDAKFESSRLRSESRRNKTARFADQPIQERIAYWEEEVAPGLDRAVEFEKCQQAFTLKTINAIEKHRQATRKNRLKIAETAEPDDVGLKLADSKHNLLKALIAFIQTEGYSIPRNVDRRVVNVLCRVPEDTRLLRACKTKCRPRTNFGVELGRGTSP